MNRVTNRTWLMAVFILVLMTGMLFFLGEYWMKADSWVSAPGSPHVYSNRNLGVGTIEDRSGTLLLNMAPNGSMLTIRPPANPPFTGWVTGRAKSAPVRFPIMPVPWWDLTGSTASTIQSNPPAPQN